MYTSNWIFQLQYVRGDFFFSFLEGYQIKPHSGHIFFFSLDCVSYIIILYFLVVVHCVDAVVVVVVVVVVDAANADIIIIVLIIIIKLTKQRPGTSYWVDTTRVSDI